MAKYVDISKLKFDLSGLVYMGTWDIYKTAEYFMRQVQALSAADVVERKPLNLPDIYAAKEYDSVADEDGNMGFGVYVPNEKQIYIAGDVPFEVRAKALFHELAHWVQHETGNKFDEDEANQFAEKVYEALSAADVVEVKRGEWIPVTYRYEFKDKEFPNTKIVWMDATEPDDIEGLKCSECGTIYDFTEARNWCSECGAKMTEEKD